MSLAFGAVRCPSCGCTIHGDEGYCKGCGVVPADRWRLMSRRDDARREVESLREQLRIAEGLYSRLAQAAYDAGDRG